MLFFFHPTTKRVELINNGLPIYIFEENNRRRFFINTSRDVINDLKPFSYNIAATVFDDIVYIRNFDVTVTYRVIGKVKVRWWDQRSGKHRNQFYLEIRDTLNRHPSRRAGVSNGEETDVDSGLSEDDVYSDED